MNITDYGFTPEMLSLYKSQDESCLARVTAVHRERFELATEFGKVFGRLKASIYYGEGLEDFPTTGDFVLISFNGSGDSQILKTLPRKSFFSRLNPTPGRGEQAVAANFDYVFIMQSLNHDFNLKRLERYSTLAWQSGAVPVIVFTKADLAGDYTEQMLAAEKTAPGINMYAVSAKTGFGFGSLSNLLKPRTTVVFLGSSGVGKSSLVNALAGEEIMPVNEIREDDSRGRHTTTHRQLLLLPNGAIIIDTPGMRELGMWDVSTGLGEAFCDVEQYFGACRFSDCKHKCEPGCAVQAAIANGALSRERWNSYIQLKNEAKYTEDKGSYMREKEQWRKGIAKLGKEIKKGGGF